MRITAEITNRPAYHQQWGDYALRPVDLREDFNDALDRALDCVRLGSVSVTVAISRDGARTGSLTLEME